jgi:phospholipase C
LSVRTVYDDGGGITLEIENRGAKDVKVRVEDDYAEHGGTHHHVEAGGAVAWHWSLDASFSWYDFTITVDGDSSFVQRIAGHVEIGGPSWSDPALGR